MRLSKSILKRTKGRSAVGRGRKFARGAQMECAIQALEMRRLFAGEYIATAIPSVLASASNPSGNSITLDKYFNDTTLPGTLVTFETTEGEVQVALTDAATPQTVANFLSYVSSGAYNDAIFHRSVDLNDGAGGSPSDPGTIIQGGGYNISDGSLAHIPTNAAVADEYTTELYGDVAGTLAMAKTSYADSATSEWYFNVTDNTELDTPTTDPNGVTTSYTVFGAVLSGTTALQDIAALPTDSLGQGLSDVPVTGISEADIQAGTAQVSGDNLVFTESVTSEPGTAFTVTSDAPALVTPKVTNGVLSFTYGSGFGTADVTITGKNLDGTSASTTVLVTVPNPATPSAGPTAANVTAPFTVTGNTGSFSVLEGSTDSLAALDPSSITLLTQPSHGTASVNSSSGFISYTPAPGYVGSDSLTFTVADANGTVSNVAAVTLSAVPTAVTVSVGAKGVSALNFIQPDGSEGHLSVLNGSAIVTFTDYRVTLTGPKNGVLTASGAGANITSVIVSDKTQDNAELQVTANGPISLGSVNDVFHLEINAPDATLTGNCSINASTLIRVAALNNVDLVMSSTAPLTTALLINSVTDSNITDLEPISEIVSSQWINTDQGTYSIVAPRVGVLQVTGEFDENLNLSSNAYDIFYAKVGTASGQWNLSGSMYNSLFSTPASSWQLTVNGLIEKLEVKGNLANQIQAAEIATLIVTGSTTNATIETSAAFSSKYRQMGTIMLEGPVSGSVIFSAGNVGSVTAGSFSDSRIYVGVNVSVAQDGDLAATTTDFTAAAYLASFVVKSSFSNSLVSADIIDKLKFGSIDTKTEPTGVSALTFKSIAGTLSPGGILNATAANLKTAATLAAYLKLKKLSLGDFEVNLI